jgi:putative transposase
LKHDWLLKLSHITRQRVRDDVAKYMKYYNAERLHSANADLSPIDLEISFRKESGWS